MSNGRPASTARWGLAQVCAAGVLWGTGGLVVTVLHDRDGFGAMTSSAWRMGLAVVALLVFAALTGRLTAVRQVLREHPTNAILVGFGTGIYQGLYFVSVLLVGVSVATVVSLGLAPLLAAGWEHFRERTRPSLREVLVLGAALVGLLLISTTTDAADAPSDRPGLGLALAVVAGATYAGTTVLGHTVSQRADPIALTTIATAAGAVLLLPFLGVAAAHGDPVVVDSTWSWVLLVYLGVATMALSYALLYAGLRTTPGSAATVATILLGERLTALGIVGGVLILVAVVALPSAGDAEEGAADGVGHPDESGPGAGREGDGEPIAGPGPH